MDFLWKFQWSLLFPSYSLHHKRSLPLELWKLACCHPHSAMQFAVCGKQSLFCHHKYITIMVVLLWFSAKLHYQLHDYVRYLWKKETSPACLDMGWCCAHLWHFPPTTPPPTLQFCALKLAAWPNRNFSVPCMIHMDGSIFTESGIKCKVIVVCAHFEQLPKSSGSVGCM